MSPFEKIDLFKYRCIERFNLNLESIVLTGSYAKGDYTSESDIDLWVLFRELQLSGLKETGRILKNIQGSPEINVQCVTTNELLTNTFKKWFSPVQIYIDGMVLYGKLPDYTPYYSEIRNYASTIAVDVLMSSRHYITSGESEESLGSGRLLKWVVKPLTWVFRYNILIRNSVFPRNLDELLKYSINGNEVNVVKSYNELLNDNFKGSYIELNELCCEIAKKHSKI